LLKEWEHIAVAGKPTRMPRAVEKGPVSGKKERERAGEK
jgi:hypothetical protein